MEAGISRSRLDNGRNCASDPAMQLAESEKKAVEQAKKIEARWPRTRWIAMAIGVGWIANTSVSPHYLHFLLAARNASANG
jgi:hypothetical protein